MTHILALLVGIAIGAIGMWIFLDREGFTDRITSLKENAAERAPSEEVTVERGKAILAFLRSYWIVLAVVVILLVFGISIAVQQMNVKPEMGLGLTQFQDKCGKTVPVEITLEDVRRGYVRVGSTEECRRDVNIQTKSQ